MARSESVSATVASQTDPVSQGLVQRTVGLSLAKRGEKLKQTEGLDARSKISAKSMNERCSGV